MSNRKMNEVWANIVRGEIDSLVKYLQDNKENIVETIGQCACTGFDINYNYDCTSLGKMGTVKFTVHYLAKAGEMNGFVQ